MTIHQRRPSETASHCWLLMKINGQSHRSHKSRLSITPQVPGLIMSRSRNLLSTKLTLSCAVSTNLMIWRRAFRTSGEFLHRPVQMSIPWKVSRISHKCLAAMHPAQVLDANSRLSDRNLSPPSPSTTVQTVENLR